MLGNWPAIKAKAIDLRESFRESFLKWALVIPVLLPMAYSIGRANGEILLVIYLLWGVLALRARDLQTVPWIGVMYAAVVITFVLGLFNALDPAQGAKTYVKFSFSLLTVFFTILCLREGRFRGELSLWFGVAALVTMGFLVIRLGYYALQPGFHPAIQVNGISAAALLPLACVFFCSRFGLRKGLGFFGILLLIALPAFVFSDSRTELLMALVGIAVLFGVYLRRLWLTVSIGLLAGPVAVLINYYLWGKGFPGLEHGWFAALDRLSSFRLSIWSLPFNYPPENPWIGVGMGNTQLYIDAASLPSKHMHNFVLEIWYETGWLGCLAFFGFCTVLLRRLPDAYRALEGERRLMFSAVLGSAVAIVIAAAFDKGYTWHAFSTYLMFCIAALFVWSRDLPRQSDVCKN